MASRKTVARFGLDWPQDSKLIDVLIYCIRKGGQWKDATTGRTVGASLFDLYREMQTVLWGDRCEHHDWSDLILRTILEQRITTVQGPKDSGKTHTMAR